MAGIEPCGHWPVNYAKARIGPALALPWFRNSGGYGRLAHPADRPVLCLGSETAGGYGAGIGRMNKGKLCLGSETAGGYGVRGRDYTAEVLCLGSETAGGYGAT